MSTTLRDIYPVLGDDDIGLIESGMELRRCPAGAVLLAEGSVSDRLFLIAEGHARVDKEHLGGFITIADLGPGQVFGEISLLLQEPATASVVMDTDGTVKSIGGEALRELALSRPGLDARLYHSLARVLAQRLVKTSRVVLPAFTGG